MSVPTVSVILATAGASAALEEVLRRARAQADELGGELVLVWNAAKGDPARPLPAAIARLAQVVVHEPRVGKSHALNSGIQAARGGICAFLDDDGLPEPGWLAALIEPLLAGGEDLAGVGGRVSPQYAAQMPPWYRHLVAQRVSFFLGPVHELGDKPREYARNSRGVLPLGANCAFRRDLLLRLGYAPDLGPNRDTGTRGGEDTLLACQVLSMGYRLVYAPGARVVHPVRPERMTEEFVVQAYYWQGVERVRISRALGLGNRKSSLQMRLRLMRYGPLLLLGRFLSPLRRIELVCKQARQRGSLDEWLGRVRVLAALLLAAFAGSACSETEEAPQDARPNIVLCVIDTLRADHLGCYGYPRSTSPRLDAFAAESVRFEHAYAQAPKTVASHASMFTSTYPAVHDAWNQAGPLDPSQDLMALAPDAICLAEVLQAVGYSTAAIADGGWLQQDRGLGQGFETFHSRFRGAKDRVDTALEWLDERPKKKPFFLFVHTYEVHTPYLPSDELLADLAPDYQGPLRDTLRAARELLAGGDLKNPIVDVHRRLFEPLLPALTEADRDFLRALYDAEIRSADREIGRLVDSLRSRGLLENTIVVVTSDHGEEFGEHGAFEHTQVYDECLRVPLLVRLPDGPRGGVRSDAVELVDLMPTLLHEAKIRVPPSAQGRVLDLRAPSEDSAARELWAETNEPVPQVAWRQGQFKILLFPAGDDDSARMFDLALDPRELAPLPPDAVPAGMIEKVRARLEIYRGGALEHRRLYKLDPIPRSRESFQDHRQEELRALGYF